MMSFESDEELRQYLENKNQERFFKALTDGHIGPDKFLGGEESENKTLNQKSCTSKSERRRLKRNPNVMGEEKRYSDSQGG